ncbi:MAG: molybdopterin-binding protein [Bacillota bacterium]|nr:molybdopterin-binding protein [Bacillota bacterium]
MRKIATENAVGQTLCHDITAIQEDGFKGVAFKRGHVITEEDIPCLLDIGKSHIFAWEPEEDEVHEEDAAMAITQASCGPGVEYSGPSEGKMQITAAREGLFRVNRQALQAINSVPDYTIACRPDCTPVSPGEKLAGARIVPLVTKRKNVGQAVKIARGGFPVFEVKPWLPLKSAVIITGSEVYYGRIRDRFEPIMRKKLETYHSPILGVSKCPDDLEMLLEAIESYMKQGAELILLTGGMSVDPDDLTPTAIRSGGAELITQGVPMQPGNMLTLARRGPCTLIGVPGASMHHPTTSLDVFLPRIFAGMPIKKEDIAAMGEGGLCLACPQCHYPLCSFGRK